MIPLDQKPLVPASNQGSNALDKPTLKPFQQGHLDAYCGVYSVINAVHHLCGPLATDEADRLISKVMKFLEDSRPAVCRLIKGTRFREILKVFDHVVIKHYPIHRLKPYSRNKDVTLDMLWCDLGNFLNANNGIVILGISGLHGHWTLVRKITANSLLLFDSDGLHRLSKRCCSVRKGSGCLHILRPTKILYLWVDGNDGGSK